MHTNWLTGDITADDWQHVLGEPWKNYTACVSAFFQNNPRADRNDFFRSEFNATVGPLGGRRWLGLDEFYGGEQFARLIAYEMGEIDCLQHAAYACGKTPDTAPYNALAAAVARFGGNIHVLDYGCGKGNWGLYALATHPAAHVTLYDYPMPCRTLIANGLNKYLQDPSRICCAWSADHNNALDAVYRKLEPPYHVINAEEVIEHVKDPIEAVQTLRELLVDDGILHMSVFFDSCHGHDPSHLDEHAHLREPEIWLDYVLRCGFKVIGFANGGAARVFQKA